MTRSVLADAFDHHVWATLRILDACRELTSDQLKTSVSGTYGTILDTLRHTVGADCGYLWVLTDGSHARIEDDEEQSMDLAALRAAMADNGPAWKELLESEPDPDGVIVRRRDDGTESAAPLGVRLAQAIHHGTDHRSQVCTALTSLGIEPPGIDAWAYAEAKGTLVVTQSTEA
jgi:uncharacterized damage-inducible protein DinB